MAILGLQGVRGGTGTTSITAALAWALQLLGETVLVVDASPDNMLRFFQRRFQPQSGLGARHDRRQRLARRRFALHLAYRSFALWSADAGRAREH